MVLVSSRIRTGPGHRFVGQLHRLLGAEVRVLLVDLEDRSAQDLTADSGLDEAREIPLLEAGPGQEDANLAVGLLSDG